MKLVLSCRLGYTAAHGAGAANAYCLNHMENRETANVKRERWLPFLIISVFSDRTYSGTAIVRHHEPGTTSRQSAFVNRQLAVVIVKSRRVGTGWQT
jgi:hypothetical protein